MTASFFAKLVRDLADSNRSQPAVKHFNPYPPNQIVPGSTTARVRRVLEAEYPAALTRAQLLFKTGAGRGAVQWALRYLQHLGQIDAFGRPGHARWHRYRFRPQVVSTEGEDHE